MFVIFILKFLKYMPRTETELQECLDLHRHYGNIEQKMFHHKHASYLARAIRSLPRGFTSLDASQSWLCYWILHSMELLSLAFDDSIYAAMYPSL